MSHVLNDFLFILESIEIDLVIISWVVACRKLLKTLLECLASEDKQLEIQVLQTLIEMLKCPDLVESFSKYAELLVLKVLHAHKIDELPQKACEVTGSSAVAVTSPDRPAKQWHGLKVAEKCAAMIARVLPVDQIIRLASTSITTEPFPKNVGAIKMLHEAVEHRGREAIEPYLSDIMPGLITVSSSCPLLFYCNSVDPPHGCKFTPSKPSGGNKFFLRFLKCQYLN